MARMIHILAMMQVMVVVRSTDDDDIHQQVSDMLRNAANLTQDHQLIQQAVQMCNYQHCDPQYDCVTQSSDLFCKLLCQTLKNAEYCEGPCSSSPCVNEATCTNKGTEEYVCSCSQGFYGDNCQFVAPPENMLIGSGGSGFHVMMEVDTGKTTEILPDVRFRSYTFMQVDWNINTFFDIRIFEDHYYAWSWHYNITKAEIRENSVLETVATHQVIYDGNFWDMAIDTGNKHIYILESFRRYTYVGDPSVSHYLSRYTYDGKSAGLSRAQLEKRLNREIYVEYNEESNFFICQSPNDMKVDSLSHLIYFTYINCDEYAANLYRSIEIIGRRSSILTACSADNGLKCDAIAKFPSFRIRDVYIDSESDQLYVLGTSYGLDSDRDYQEVLSMDLTTLEIKTLYHGGSVAGMIVSRLNFIYLLARGRGSVYRLPKSGGDLEKLDWKTTSSIVEVA